MKKLFTFAAAVSALFLAGTLFASNDLSDLRGLSLSNAKIPIYNRGGKPQMMIFVNRAERHGRVISGTGTVLEFIRKTASVDDIGDAWKLKPYPLKAPFRQVFDFWLPRVKYSEAVVTTPKADIDQESHKASGSAPVFLRSPLLDLNGVGFEADFDRREIRINSDIHVLIRTGSSDPRKFKSGENKKYEYITATGDSLLIELEARRIMLIGSVEVIENQAKISCDRLTVMLSRGGEKNNENKKGKKEAYVFDAESEVSGISQLLADGNVIITGSGKNTGKMHADHLVYDVKNSRITLTSDDFGSVLSKKELKQQALALSKKSPDEIPGYVILDDAQIRTYGKTVHVNLNRSGNGLPAGGLISGVPDINQKADTGALKNITYPDGIILSGKPAPGKEGQTFSLSADHGEFLPGQNVINLTRNVSAEDSGTTLTCDKAALKLRSSAAAAGSPASRLDAILCRNNVQLLHRDAQSRTGNLVSDKADFFPESNRIVFYENVRAKHENSDMTCNQLELFLADRTDTGKKISRVSGQLMDTASSAKTLKRAVATGNVYMKDPNAELTTGILTMHFRNLAANEKPTPGMLQAGGVRLATVECDNGVKIVSSDVEGDKSMFGSAASKGKRILRAMRSTTDLLTNVSTFSGNVRVYDDLSRISCSTLRLFGKETAVQKAAQVKSSAAAAADLDADPFAMLNTENYAPSRIAIAGNLELERVECLEDVLITRTVNRERLQAGAQRADYAVKTGKVILSGEAPDRPWIQMGYRRQESDQLIYHLAEERFESRGKIKVMTLEDEKKRSERRKELQKQEELRKKEKLEKKKLAAEDENENNDKD